MRRSTAPTLQDVAREAGVTAMTVSVVLNGARSATRVSEATRGRIQEAAARLRYRPNAVARGLCRRRMDTLGVVAVVDVAAGDINVYFLEVLNGILTAAARHEQNTTVFSVTDWRQDEAKILRFCDGRVDGLVFIGPHFTPEFAESLERHACFVTVHGPEGLAHGQNIGVDDENGAYAAVRHLTSLGHRRIAHFSGPPEVAGTDARLAGYQRALAEAGVPSEERLVVPGELNIQSGRARAISLLECGEPRPTAIFCGNDAVAYGCVEALTGHGLRIPADMSVVGFDDVLLSRMTLPHLTTVRQPFRAMGECAVERLLSQIGSDSEAGSTMPGGSTEVFPVELVVRGSVGPPA